MINSNKKCNGCGAYLTNQLNMIGYTPQTNEKKLDKCQRCFQLVHYNKLTNPSEFNLDNSVDAVLAQLDLKELAIFVVLDIFDLEHTIIDQLQPYAKQIIFVVNKIDLLPKSYQAHLVDENIKKILAAHSFVNNQILYCSIHHKTSIKRLMQALDVLPNKQKAIFFGKSNVGKSSLINALLVLNQQKPQLTTSSFTNTTLNINKLVLNKRTVLDAPGISFQTNILNYINSSINKYVMIANDSKFVTYQLNQNQALLLSGLVGIQIISADKCSITLYLSAQLDIHRCKLANFETLWNKRAQLMKYNYEQQFNEFIDFEFELDMTKKTNINIAGLGMIAINGKIAKLKIRAYQQVSVLKATAAII